MNHNLWFHNNQPCSCFIYLPLCLTVDQFTEPCQDTNWPTDTIKKLLYEPHLWFWKEQPHIFLGHHYSTDSSLSNGAGKEQKEKAMWCLPLTMTLIILKSISPLAMTRASQLYMPSSVFLMPRICRWPLAMILNRTKAEKANRTVTHHIWYLRLGLNFLSGDRNNPKYEGHVLCKPTCDVKHIYFLETWPSDCLGLHKIK